LALDPCENDDAIWKIVFTPPTTIEFEDTTLRSLNNIPGPITIESVVTFSELNSQLSSFATITLQLWLAHPMNGNCEIRLYGPDGSYIMISNQRGGNNANVFNGTIFSDSASNLVSTYSFSNNIVASPLQPEQPFSSFTSKNPNGQWKLWINDTIGGNNGILSEVKLKIQGK